ncbi:MAG TPA: hypothetical protein VHU19_10160 [Pyrinomonadaceae bacterium]|nr:hypothetical protein [Pyrinomonadaceae bacterium]
MKARIIRASLLTLMLCGALLSPLAGRVGAQARRTDSRLVAQAEHYSGDTFPFETKTPRGVQVYAVNKPVPEALRAIDDGLTELFAVARRHGYTARLNYTDYTVFIARADRTRDSAGAYSPDIALGAAQYAGSVYDQGGYIYAAGMVLSTEPCAFLIAEHERDFQRIANVTRYEGEHIVLFHNDRRLYEQTADHSRGGGHPILK